MNNFCEMKITKDACWNNDREINCTWTPVINSTTGNFTTSNADGGHCCGEGGVWKLFEGGCYYRSANICNVLWSITNQEEPARIKSSANLGYFDQYCVQIAHGGGSLGMYYPVETY